MRGRSGLAAGACVAAATIALPGAALFPGAALAQAPASGDAASAPVGPGAAAPAPVGPAGVADSSAAAPGNAGAGDPAPAARRGKIADVTDLYEPSPTRTQIAAASSWYTRYGRTISQVELRQGVRIGDLATAPAGPPAATRRAGLDGVAASGPLKGILTATLLALLAAAALLLATPGVARATSPDGYLGISTEDVYTGTDEYAAEQLAAQAKAGITVARQDFRWNEIEWAKHHYDFSATDRFVARTAKAGIRVLPQLKGEPQWATSRAKRGSTKTKRKERKSRSLFPPRRNSDLASFGKVIAERYGVGGSFWKEHPELPELPITSYQIWNEPNLRAYWGDKPSAKAYASMVKSVGKAIRKVDPDAAIVSGGIPNSRGGQAPKTYLKELLAAGAGKYLDAIGAHPYSASTSGVMRAMRQLRREVNAGKGGRKLDLWITEYGIAAGGPKAKDRSVSLSQQGPRIVSTYRALTKARGSLKLRGIVYFAWRDSEVYKGGKDFWGLHTGLLDRSGSPKPAFSTVTTAWPTL